MFQILVNWSFKAKKDESNRFPHWLLKLWEKWQKKPVGKECLPLKFFWICKPIQKSGREKSRDHPAPVPQMAGATQQSQQLPPRRMGVPTTFTNARTPHPLAPATIVGTSSVRGGSSGLCSVFSGMKRYFDGMRRVSWSSLQQRLLIVHPCAPLLAET